MTALIGFLRELEEELSHRADGWALDASKVSSPDLAARFGITAAVLRELAGAILAVSKRTFLT